MVEIFEELKQNQILHGKSVAALRKYIQQKYPDDHIDLKSKVFADAVNKIIDHNIDYFDDSIKIHIKRNLFKQIAKKEIFTINAYEVFEACTHLDLQDQNYLNGLTAWMNSNQSETIIREEVLALTLELRETFVNSTVPIESEPVLLEEEVVLITDIPIEPPIEEPIMNTISVVRIGLPRIQLPEIPLTPIVLQEEPASRTRFAQQTSMAWKVLQNFRKPQEKILSWFQTHYKMTLISIAILVGLSLIISVLLPNMNQHTIPTTHTAGLTINKDRFLDLTPIVTAEINIKRTFDYQDVNLEMLKNWLIDKNSLLAEDPYFSSILKAAKEYNVHPLLLFAITGQEQAFVPNTNKRASIIANNPFNVFGSWEAYNTNIDEASRIAAKTIVNLRKDCPESMDVIKWINRKYAEDPNWHIGVSKIFAQLEDAMTEDID